MYNAGEEEADDGEGDGGRRVGAMEFWRHVPRLLRGGNRRRHDGDLNGDTRRCDGRSPVASRVDLVTIEGGVDGGASTASRAAVGASALSRDADGMRGRWRRRSGGRDGGVAAACRHGSWMWRRLRGACGCGCARERRREGCVRVRVCEREREEGGRVMI